MLRNTQSSGNIFTLKTRTEHTHGNTNGNTDGSQTQTL